MLYRTILYYTMLCYVILYHTLMYYTILHHTILYYTILCYTMLYCTLLYCIAPYYIVLYYSLLYYTILYCTLQYYTVLCYSILYYYFILYVTLYYTIRKSAPATARPRPAAARPRGAGGVWGAATPPSGRSGGQSPPGSLNYSASRNSPGLWPWCVISPESSKVRWGPNCRIPYTTQRKTVGDNTHLRPRKDYVQKAFICPCKSTELPGRQEY